MVLIDSTMETLTLKAFTTCAMHYIFPLEIHQKMIVNTKETETSFRIRKGYSS